MLLSPLAPLLVISLASPGRLRTVSAHRSTLALKSGSDVAAATTSVVPGTEPGRIPSARRASINTARHDAEFGDVWRWVDEADNEEEEEEEYRGVDDDDDDKCNKACSRTCIAEAPVKIR